MTLYLFYPCCMTRHDRNLSFLVNECSWYSKPLLLQVMALLHRCIQPVHANCNDFNLVACAVICTPFILRPYHPLTSSSIHLNQTSVFAIMPGSISTTTNTTVIPPLYHQHDIDQLYMSATAVGSSTVEFLISYYHDIFQSMHHDYTMKYTRLHQKCHALKKLHIQLQDSVDTNYAQYLSAEKETLIMELWVLLEDAEQLILCKL